MSHSPIRGKRILIFQQRSWAVNVGHPLAKSLQEEGAILAAFTLKRTTHQFIASQREVRYDLVVNNDEIMGRPKDYLKGDVFPLALINKEIGVDSIWPIVMSLRNHVRSYKDKYYYAFRQNVSDEGIIDYVMALYKCVRRVFDEFKPDLIIAPNFVALPHIMFSLYGKKRGVPMFGVTDSKVSGNYIFSYDHTDGSGPFHDRVDLLNRGEAESENLDKARAYIKEFRERFIAPTYTQKEIPKTLWQKIRHLGSPYYHILRWYIRPSENRLDSTGITIDYRPPRIILRDHYCHDRYAGRAKAFPYHPFEKISKFVYLPLQFQPEANIDVASPFFSNQIETARQAAMSLPDDYTLVVKDHPAMLGYRPPSYLEKLARTVNIKLIDYRIPSYDILKRASLVISQNSSVLVEAAFLRIPAIQLGDLGTTLKLPNVSKHTDMTTLVHKIKEVLKVDLHTPQYERRLENYVAAAYDTGFDVNYFSLWERGGDTSPIWSIYKKEIESALGKKASGAKRS
ncbi:MAG: hypothetical protein ABSF56_02055 [Minisyncoccia bacterium]|jgi:hypothetical protein